MLMDTTVLGDGSEIKKEVEKMLNCKDLTTRIQLTSNGGGGGGGGGEKRGANKRGGWEKKKKSKNPTHRKTKKSHGKT
jgi:hypothetical protein